MGSSNSTAPMAGGSNNSGYTRANYNSSPYGASYPQNYSQYRQQFGNNSMANSKQLPANYAQQLQLLKNWQQQQQLNRNNYPGYQQNQQLSKPNPIYYE